METEYLPCYHTLLSHSLIYTHSRQISKETIEPAKLPIQIPTKKHVVDQQVTNMKNGESMNLVANDTAVNNDDSDLAADNDNTDEHDDTGEDNPAGDSK